ncbi:unnamed protein product [Tilletia controversa]|nr:unnamed protein product [Tilletia controversa]
MQARPVRLTNYPAIKNAPLPYEGSGSFSNLHLALAYLFTSAILLRVIPFVKASWVPWWLYFVLVLLTGVSGSGTAVADEVPQDVEGLQRACTERRLRTSGVDSLTMSEVAFFFLPPAFGFRPVAQYVTA